MTDKLLNDKEIPKQSLVLDDTYQETLRLADGAPLTLRMLRPDDKPRLLAGFERLSPESRYRRFMTPKKALTPGDLRLFTEFDGFDHFAFGAFERCDDGADGDCIGVARVVRSREPEVAELALAVTDDRQGMGLGRLLMERAIGGASERGVARIRCYLKGDNERMRRLIRGFFADTEFIREDAGMLKGELPIPKTHAPTEALPAGCGLENLLRLMAEGTLMPLSYGVAAMERTAGWLGFSDSAAADSAGD